MTDELLKIENMTIGYAQPVCESINAKVNKGELIALCGKNGSGKSTLIRSILGLQPILSGNVTINGENFQNLSLNERARKVAVVFSRLPQVPAIKVFDMVSLGRLPYSDGFSKLNRKEKQRIEDSIERVGITELRNKFATQLSDGQLQMAMVARALTQETELILMDEPSSHLDIENQFKIFELIHKLSKEINKTFIVATHQVELVLQNAKQLWWIGDGKFNSGYTEQIAYEQRVYEKLAQNQIRFDYENGCFQFKHPVKKTVNFKPDGSELSYWLKHALERNYFGISNQSEIKIEINENQIQLNRLKFDKIESVISYLKNEGK